MRAIAVMVRDVVTVHPDTDVAEAISLLAEHDVSALPVVVTVSNRVAHLWGSSGRSPNAKHCLRWLKACTECLGLPMK
jgi:CBS-domain-containing membrane protein